MPDPDLAPYFTNGTWERGPDVLGTASDAMDGDVTGAIAHLGFELWCSMGGEFGEVPLTLELYLRRDASPEFLLQIEGRPGGSIEHVYAGSLPDAMELLARWAPAVQAAAVTELIREVHEGNIRGIAKIAEQIGKPRR